MEQKITELLVVQSKHGEQIAMLSSRCDKQDALMDTVNNLAISIERLANGQDALRTNMDNGQQSIIRDVRALRGDVDELRQKPSKRWETVVTAVVTGVVAYAIGRLTKGM